MTTTDVQTFTDLEAFVWLGFRHDVSLDFKVTLPRDKDDVRRVLDAVGCYNAFQPAEAFAIIDGYWDSLMAVDLAREGSVALYFRFPHAERQRLVNREAADYLPYSWGTERITGDETARIARMLMRDLRDEHADEVGYDAKTRVVRAWWD